MPDQQLGLSEFSPGGQAAQQLGVVPQASMGTQVVQALSAGFHGNSLSQIQRNYRQKQLVERLQRDSNNPNVMAGAAAQELSIIDPEAVERIGKAIGTTEISRQRAFFEDIQKANRLMNARKFELIPTLFQNRIKALDEVGAPTEQTVFIANEFQKALSSGDPEAMGEVAANLAQLEQQGIIDGYIKGPGGPSELDQAKIAEIKKRTELMGTKEGGEKPAGVKEFEFMTEGLEEEQVNKAKLIKLGLEGRAVENALMNIAEKGIAEQVGDASAIIKQREKFGTMTGASRAKAIDSGFEKMKTIDAGIINFDRATAALKAGAGVGAVEKWLPSFKAASVALDNIRGAMALDVVGAVSFGALSAGELSLAKDVALPDGLDTDELLAWVAERKNAQQKLRAYFYEQIQFLDQGGTIAGFLRMKERSMGQGAAAGGGGGSRFQIEEIQ